MKGLLMQGGLRVLLGMAVAGICLLRADDAAPTAVAELETIFVEAETFGRVNPFSTLSADYLKADDLEQIAAPTLGETLGWRPGVNQSWFGPGASRPVIRGFEGYRVRTLQDGIGTLDVSDSSPDHGVALEPLLIREIDIYRGPGALLYGNAAIGGAVNASSRLIPPEAPEEALSGSTDVHFSSVDEGKSASGFAHAQAENIVVTAVGAAQEKDDYDIPASARTEAYEKAFRPLTNDPSSGQTVAVVNPAGTLPNTFHESETRGIGVAWLPEAYPLTLGSSYTRHDSEYGLPWQYGGDPNDLFGFSSLKLRHERFDVDGSLTPAGEAIGTFHTRLGYGDYNHIERFSGQGKDSDKAFSDTVFDQHALEVRSEWMHRPFDGLEGVAGISGQRQDLSASFLAAPPLEISRFHNHFETRNLGFFALETASIGEFSLQGGVRYETQTITDTSLESFGFVTQTGGQSRSFALTPSWNTERLSFLDRLTVSPTLSLTERIPTASERHAFWPNPAIQRFLIGGDRDGVPLENEESFGLELTLEAHRGEWSKRLSVYRYDYANFIYLRDIKGIGNLSQYTESEAAFYGYESELAWKHLFLADEERSIKLSGLSDAVRGHNETEDAPLPRMPPLRVGSRAQLNVDSLEVGFEYRYAFAQDQVQPESAVALPEMPTEAYSEVNLDVAYTQKVAGSRLTPYLKINNLLNEERRLHTSFVKDVAPLPSLNVTLGLKWAF